MPERNYMSFGFNVTIISTKIENPTHPRRPSYHYRAYIAFHPGHRYHGIDFKVFPVIVYGGWTFSELTEDGSWIIGFDIISHDINVLCGPDIAEELDRITVYLPGAQICSERDRILSLRNDHVL